MNAVWTQERPAVSYTGPGRPRCTAGENVSAVFGRGRVASVTLAARGARFFAAEFVGMAALVRGPSAQAGDLTLALRVHGGKAAHAPALGHAAVALGGFIL
jgi:hypothetical protein